MKKKKLPCGSLSIIFILIPYPGKAWLDGMDSAAPRMSVLRDAQ